MIYERITEKNLDLALRVAAEIFPYEVKNGVNLSFEDDAYRGSIKENKPDFAYYLAYEECEWQKLQTLSLHPLKVEDLGCDTGKYVVGITGFYREADGTMWLGWFGVLPAFRGCGMGGKILRDTAKMVSELGVEELFIYSGQRIEERNAHRLYENHGFFRTGEGDCSGEPVFFFRGPVPIKEKK